MTPSPVTPEKAYRLVLIIWAALFASIGMYYVVCRTLLQPAKVDPDAPLAVPLLVLAILMVLSSRYFATRLGTRGGRVRTPAKVQAGYILALMMSESIALYGVVILTTSGWEHYWVFFAISVVAFILNFPRRDAFEQASP